MEKKLMIIAEVLFVLIAITYYTIKELIPEYKTKFGSSDKIVNPTKYKNMVEISLDNGIDFALLIDENKKVFHIFFFTEESYCLYNKNIENTTIKESSNQIIKELIENDYLKTTSNIKVTRYTDAYYEYFINKWKESLKKYGINTEVIEETNTLDNKSQELKINPLSTSSIIVNMDYYSKEIIRMAKSHKGDSIIVELDNKTAKTLSNNVYKKIEEYVYKNKINNLEKNNTELLITIIPADEKAKYYPTNNSWYYVKDGKVYAYIEFTQNKNIYGYCYTGSIDYRSEGECPQ